MPTEYTIREKLLLSSSTPSILFSLPSNPAILSSLYFPFSLLFCTSVSSSSDASHKNCSSLESWLSIPASFSIATAILQTSFLNPHNLLNLSNFLNTSIFHSVSVCCFVFLALDLQIASILAFVHVLSTSKSLQAVLALVQGVHKVTWLQELAEEEQLKQILMANFGKYKVFQSPRISHMDFLYQQQTSPFLLPISCIIDRPPEFPWANNKHVASWSEAGDWWGSFPCQKEEMKETRRSLPNFCTIVVPR